MKRSNSFWRLRPPLLGVLLILLGLALLALPRQWIEGGSSAEAADHGLLELLIGLIPLLAGMALIATAVLAGRRASIRRGPGRVG